MTGYLYERNKLDFHKTFTKYSPFAVKILCFMSFEALKTELHYFVTYLGVVEVACSSQVAPTILKIFINSYKKSKIKHLRLPRVSSILLHVTSKKLRLLLELATYWQNWRLANFYVEWLQQEISLQQKTDIQENKSINRELFIVFVIKIFR